MFWNKELEERVERLEKLALCGSVACEECGIFVRIDKVKRVDVDSHIPRWQTLYYCQQHKVGYDKIVRRPGLVADRYYKTIQCDENGEEI